MTRKEQIEAAAKDWDNYHVDEDDFVAGAKWADKRNPWKELCFEMYTQLIWIRNLSDQCSVTHKDLISLYEALKDQAI